MTPEKAKENLRRLTEQLQAHVKECKPHETVASRDLLLWFIDAAAKTLDKKKPIPLESALGLKRGRGRIKTGQPGRYFQLALTVARLRGEGLSLKKIADQEGYEPRELQKICEREHQALIQHYLAEMGELDFGAPSK